MEDRTTQLYRPETTLPASANHPYFNKLLEKQRISYLQLASWIGTPVVLIGGFILHFVVGIKLFPNTPTISEYLSERARPKSTPPPPKLV